MQSKHSMIFAGIVLALAAAQASAGDEHVVSQKNKAFSQKSVRLKVGDTIKFVNDDKFAHNVFSLSDAKSFDLGTYSTGASKTVVFDKPGTVEVECAIHPDMKMVVEVGK